MERQKFSAIKQELRKSDGLSNSEIKNLENLVVISFRILYIANGSENETFPIFYKY